MNQHRTRGVLVVFAGRDWSLGCASFRTDGSSRCDRPVHALRKRHEKIALLCPTSLTTDFASPSHGQESVLGVLPIRALHESDMRIDFLVVRVDDKRRKMD